MNEHTPGKWEWGELGDLAVGNLLIAYCTYYGIEVPNPADKAMIAAAPDLLRVLEAVEWVYNSREGQGECQWCRELERDGHAPDCQRQAAIAKARGEG